MYNKEVQNSPTSQGIFPSWGINFGEIFLPINPHKERFYEYENYNVGDVLLGNDLIDKTIGHGEKNQVVFSKMEGLKHSLEF